MQEIKRDEFPMNILIFLTFSGAGTAAFVPLWLNHKYELENTIFMWALTLISIVQFFGTFILGYKLEKYLNWIKVHRQNSWQKYLVADKRLGAAFKILAILSFCYIAREFICLFTPMIVATVLISFLAYLKGKEASKNK